MSLLADWRCSDSSTEAPPSETQPPRSQAGLWEGQREPHPPRSPLQPTLTTLQACTGHADHNAAEVEMEKVDILASSLWRAGHLQTRWSLCNGPTLLPRRGHGHGRVPHTCGHDPVTLWATTSEALLSENPSLRLTQRKLREDKSPRTKDPWVSQKNAIKTPA